VPALTRRGTLFLVGAMAMVISGRMFALPELFGLAAAAIALVVAACFYVGLARYRVSAIRQVRPPRVHAGSGSRVELSVRNLGGRRTPVLGTRDPFDGGRRWARFQLAPLDPGETARAAYRLPTEERGVFALGPLQLTLSDPFGLASTTSDSAPQTSLTVYPRIDQIRPLPQAPGPDPNASATHPTALTLTGEDFYALREYQPGDDIRRVHWPSTARLDELMIRQDELPWQGRTTVVADLRAIVHTSESFELVLSAVASILTAGWRTLSLTRMLTTDGTDSGFGSGHAHREALLEYLAAAAPRDGMSLVSVLGGLSRHGSTGGLVIVTTSRAASQDLAAAGALRPGFGASTVVVFERSSWDPTPAGTQAPTRPVPSAGRFVRVTAGSPFPEVWERTVAGGRRRAGAFR
jgi:uncharacterized protein (DUF58 family)